MCIIPDTHIPNQTDQMKTKIFLAHIIILMFCFQNLFCQKTSSINNTDSNEGISSLTGELFTPDLIVDPTTYFNREWLAGDIYLSNGEVVRNKLIKYNGLLDELFWQEPRSKNVVKLDKEAILQFHFLNLNSDSTVYFRKLKVKKYILADSAEVFGEVVYDGSLSLFILHTYKFEGTELIRKGGSLFEKKVYNEEPIYIFRSANNKTFVAKSLKRKSLYAFSPGNKDKIKDFLKTNKTGKFINNLYLVRLTQFLGTLSN